MFPIPGGPKPQEWGFMTIAGKVLYRVWLPLNPREIKSHLIIELPLIKKVVKDYLERPELSDD